MNASGDARREKALVAAFLLLALVESVHLAELRLRFCERDGIVSVRDLVDGVSYTPFQYRVLTPLLMRFHERLTGIPPALALGGIETFCGLLIVCVTAVYLHHFIRARAYCMLTSLLCFNLLTFNLVLPGPTHFPYDMSGLLFFAAGLLLMAKERWALYMACFAVGTYNRETTCFLTVLYAVVSWGRRPAREWVALAAAQTAVWLAIKTHLAWTFRDNPQLGPFTLCWLENLRYVSQPDNWPFLLCSFGFIGVPAILLWRQIDSVFARRCLTAILPYVAGMFLVGRLEENRVFIELYPVVLLAYALVLRRFADTAPPKAD